MTMAEASKRHYGMDWLRIGAFCLLIVYHVGFNFTPWGYQTPSRGAVPYAELPLLGLSPWRLSLLFAISGYASAALLSRQPSLLAFARSRLVRLGVPFAFAMVFIVPPQIWIGLVNGPKYPHGLAYFTLHDFFSFTTIMGEYVPRMMHMWFVLYLLAYTLVLLALMGLPTSWRALASRATDKVLGSAWLIPAGIAWVYAVRLLPHGWTDQHAFLADRAAHLHYFPLFVFGFALRRSEAIRRAVTRQWKIASVVSIAGFAWIAGDTIAFPGNIRTPDDLYIPFLVARAALGWAAVIALFGIADRFWNHDHPWRATLAEAVFPVYIAHQTVTVFTIHLIFDWGLSALPEFLILSSFTAIGSWIFYLIGREVTVLRPFIGLSARKRPPRQAPMAEQPKPKPAG